MVGVEFAAVIIKEDVIAFRNRLSLEFQLLVG
jgi:hypothetical protein